MAEAKLAHMLGAERVGYGHTSVPGSGRELISSVVVSGLPVVRAETARLTNRCDAVETGLGGGSAGRAPGRVAAGIDSPAGSAQPDIADRPFRVADGYPVSRAAPLVIREADGGVNPLVLDDLAARRELADRDVDLTSDLVSDLASAWPVLVQQPFPRREPEHRQDPGFC